MTTFILPIRGSLCLITRISHQLPICLKYVPNAPFAPQQWLYAARQGQGFPKTMSLSLTRFTGLIKSCCKPETYDHDP